MEFQQQTSGKQPHATAFVPRTKWIGSGFRVIKGSVVLNSRG